MKRWKRLGGTLLLSTLLAATPLWAAGTEAAEKAKGHEVDLQLLSINDLHGQLNVTDTIDGKQVGGADVLATYLKERAADNKNTWMVHVGDAVGASAPVSALLQDEPTIEILNEIGFDLGTIGNHEFDEGVEEMLRLIHGGEHEKTGDFAGADFPYTVANVNWKESGKPVLPPHIVKKVKGIPVGFIGVVTTETPHIVSPDGVKEVTFTDEAKAIDREVERLKEKGVKAIVVMAHEGGFQDSDTGKMEGPIVEMTRSIDDEVDVVISGHTHSYLNGTVDGKLLVQSYSSGTAFSDIDLTLNRHTGDITNKQAEVVTTYHQGVQPDPQIRKMIQSYEEEVAPIINEEVGEAKTAITREASPAGESAMGNLIADAQRWKTGTDFAFMNPGGIRADLDRGPVTWGELYTVQPFDNNLVTMTLTGEQIERLLNQQWQEDGTRMLQISGLTYTWDPTRPAGDRIVELKKADGTPIQADASYTVTANSFIASGGDNFTVFSEAKDQVTAGVDLDALIQYVKQLPQPFSAEVENRIKTNSE